MFELKIIGIIGYECKEYFCGYKETRIAQGDLLYQDKIIYKGRIILCIYNNFLTKLIFLDDFEISDISSFLLDTDVTGQIKLNNEFLSFHRENYVVEFSLDGILVRDLTFTILY